MNNGSQENKYVRQIRKDIEENEKRIQRAYKEVPLKYHGYIILLEQAKKVFNFALEDIPNDLKSRVYSKKASNKEATYLVLNEPYTSVDGRVAMFVDEHREKNQKYIVTTNIEEVNKILLECNKLPPFYNYTIEIESEIYGKVTASAKINIGGNGADSSNPIENAETSAYGRALGFFGIGTFGNGIASAEEIYRNKEDNDEEKINRSEKDDIVEKIRSRNTNNQETIDQESNQLIDKEKQNILYNTANKILKDKIKVMKMIVKYRKDGITKAEGMTEKQYVSMMKELESISKKQKRKAS